MYHTEYQSLVHRKRRRTPHTLRFILRLPSEAVVHLPNAFQDYNSHAHPYGRREQRHPQGQQEPIVPESKPSNLFTV